VVTAPETVPAEIGVSQAPPVTFHKILAAELTGATPAVPVTVAVKVSVEFKAPEPEPVRRIVGATRAIVTTVEGDEARLAK
jgi:hypothetical protein